ncbi:hypothetical protein INR49_020592, partial [Caranx melampygus]
MIMFPQIFSCLMAFFLCNMMETHFLSTGAFEVTLNDVPVWSKLQSGYVPNIQEICQILDNHLKMNQWDVQTLAFMKVRPKSRIYGAWLDIPRHEASAPYAP